MEISNKNRPVKFGVISFLVFAILLVVFMFYIIGSNQKLFDAKYKLYMFQPNVQNLSTGAFITLSGLKVGVVGELKFTKKDNKQGILIELKIDKNYSGLITESSAATTKTMGILGDKYVDISLGDLNDPILNDGDFIKSNIPIDPFDILELAGNTIRDFQLTIRNISILSEQAINDSGVLGMVMTNNQFKNDLVQLLENLKFVTNQVRQGKGSLGKFVQDTSLYRSFVKTSASLEDITKKIQKSEGSLGKMISDTTFYVKVNSITTKTDSLLQQLRGNSSVGKLVNDDELYSQLLKLIQSLNDITQDIKKNPRKYTTIKLF